MVSIYYLPVSRRGDAPVPPTHVHEYEFKPCTCYQNLTKFYFINNKKQFFILSETKLLVLQ